MSVEATTAVRLGGATGSAFSLEVELRVEQSPAWFGEGVEDDLVLAPRARQAGGA